MQWFDKKIPFMNDNDRKDIKRLCVLSTEAEGLCTDEQIWYKGDMYPNSTQSTLDVIGIVAEKPAESDMMTIAFTRSSAGATLIHQQDRYTRCCCCEIVLPKLV